MEPILSHPKDTALVVKHNRLIEGRYDLTLQEKRLILWLVSEIKAEDKELRRYRVSIHELAEFIGIEKNKNIYRQMAEIAEKLMKRVIQIWSDDKQRLTLFHWVSAAEYNFGSGFVEFRLSDELIPYLLELKKNFTKLALKYAVSLKSAHAIRIYELLKQYETIGERTLEVASIRVLCGIGEKQYALYTDVKRNVIDIARREINEKTDIRFDYEEIKLGRKVHAIRFVISPNEEANDDPILDDPRLAKLLSNLQRHGIPEAQARAYLVEYDQDLERIEHAIKALEKQLKTTTKEKIENPTAWLISAISADYRPQRTLFQVEADSTRSKEIERVAMNRERLAELKPLVLTIRNAYSAHVKDSIRDYIDSLSRDDAVQLNRDFEAFLKENKASMLLSKFDGGRTWYTGANALILRPYILRFLVTREGFALASVSDFAKSQGADNFEALDAEYAELEKLVG